MTYVRSCIAALVVVFSNLLTAGAAEPHYHLTLDRQKNNVHLTFTSPSAPIDLTIPYKDALFTKPLKHPSIQVQKDNKHIQFAFKDKHAAFKILMSPQLDLDLKEMAVDGSCSVTLKNPSAQSRISTSSKLSVKKDFLLDSPQTRFVITAVRGLWEIGGKAQFKIPKAAVQLEGRIISQDTLSLKAHALTMPYGTTKKVRHHSAADSDNCHSYVSQRVDDRALLHSQQADVVLDVDHAEIRGSTISAHRQVIITFQDYFKNLAVTLENMKCYLEEKKIKGWFSDDYVDVAREHLYDTLDAAIIQAGQAVSFTMGKETAVFDASHKQGSRKLSRLENTGRIEGGSVIDIASDNSSGYLKNKTPEHTPYTNYKELLRLALANEIPVEHKKQAGKHDVFKYIHSSYHNEEPLRPLTELGFSATETTIKSGTEPMLLSPMLEADTLFKVLSNQGLPLLEQSCRSDYYCLLNHLQENGFWYALVNGALKEIPDAKEVKIPKPTLSLNEKAFYAGTAKKYYEAVREFNRIKGVSQFFELYKQPEKLYQRLLAIKSGKYRTELSEDEYEKALIPLIYYRTKSIEGREYVVPVLHLPKQTVVDSHTGGLITAQSVNIHDMAKVVNKGMIRAINKLKIQALQVVNSQSKQYSIKVPLPGGQLIGFTVEITVPQETAQKGLKPGIENSGTIFATHKVLLNAQQGDILLATHVAQWDRKAMQKVFGSKSPLGSVDFYPGRVAAGSVDIIAHAGYLINHGAQIIADKNIHLKAFKDVIFKTLTSTHSNQQLVDDDLSVEKITEEALKIQRASATALNGDLTVTSIDGSLLDQSGSYQAKKTLIFDAKKS